jgi:hypothetical protein
MLKNPKVLFCWVFLNGARFDLQNFSLPGKIYLFPRWGICTAISFTSRADSIRASVRVG